MRRFLRNPQHIGETGLKAGSGEILYLNADPLVDVDNGHIGYQVGLLVKNTFFYEQSDHWRSRHLIKVSLPESILQAIVGRKLSSVIEGIKKMKGIWDEESTITGIETIKGSHYMAVPVPSWPIDNYLGEGARD